MVLRFISFSVDSLGIVKSSDRENSGGCRGESLFFVTSVYFCVISTIA